jgi:SAM-dependent methyltransferase
MTRMTTANEEYVTDVPYMRGFASDLSPLMLRLVAALNGFPVPRHDDFAYCEMGSAHGDTTATLAAAYPGARFFGVDINPEHIATASRLASDGGLDNVRFLERDFADLARDDIPDLDFLTAHGVLSWIGPVKRKAIVDFASAKLKPGGLLYVSYNALPGWAAVEPLRQLMLDRGAAVGGSSLHRAREGLALAKLLCESGAAYFTGNPAAKDMLERMEKIGLPYVVHEYLHAHWVPMYFAQVAAEMAASDLYFVGQLPLHLNYRDLAIPASLAGVFKGVTDRVTFESLKDYATNEFFRRDVFVKGRVQRDEAAATAYLDSTPFGTLIGEGEIARDVRLPHHTLHFVGEIFDALFPALAEGATTVTDLAGVPQLAGFGTVRLRDAIVRLVLAGQVSPTIAKTHATPAPAGRFRVVSAYNRMQLRERLSSEHPIVLASAVAGTGVRLPMLEGVMLRLLTEIPETDWAAWVAAFAQRQPFRMRVGDRAVEDDEERVRVLLEQVDPFRAKRLPRLIELGIVARETA